jgi:hypothetical protein
MLAMGNTKEVQVKKSGPVEYETLMRYKKEFGIEDPDRAAEVLGFYPNKDTIVPFDFKEFKSDIEKKRARLRAIQEECKYLEMRKGQVDAQRNHRFEDLMLTTTAYKDIIVSEIIRI